MKYNFKLLTIAAGISCLSLAMAHPHSQQLSITTKSSQTTGGSPINPKMFTPIVGEPGDKAIPEKAPAVQGNVSGPGPFKLVSSGSAKGDLTPCDSYNKKHPGHPRMC
jgi:hypothetical protein